MHLEHRLHLYAYLAKHLQQSLDDGLAEEKPRLFRHVYTGVKANTKRALDAKDMSKLLWLFIPAEVEPGFRL